MSIDIYKVYDALTDIKSYIKPYKFNDQEIIKLIRELLFITYERQGNADEYNQIHLYFLICDCLDIYGQMLDKRKFDVKYLKDTLKF
jgi:hypothetical protein